LEQLVNVVRQVFFVLPPVSFESRLYQQFVEVQRDFGLTVQGSWIDYVRSFSFGELDSHLQQMD
jgi:hypothetical protein